MLIKYWLLITIIGLIIQINCTYSKEHKRLAKKRPSRNILNKYFHKFLKNKIIFFVFKFTFYVNQLIE